MTLRRLEAQANALCSTGQAQELRGVQIPPPALPDEPPRVMPVGDIVSFGLWMQKRGYRSSTIHYCIQAIKSIARQANLLDPESAKTYLASAQISEARKAKLAEDLARFYGWKRIPFEKPSHRRGIWSRQGHLLEQDPDRTA